MNQLPSYDDTNIFARILRGEIPCDKVFESEHTLAFNDIAPQAPIHVLVIPKGQYVTMADFAARASIAQQTDLFAALATVIANLSLEEGGYRLLVNNGVAARQEVPHLHWHVLAGQDLGPMLAPQV